MAGDGCTADLIMSAMEASDIGGLGPEAFWVEVSRYSSSLLLFQSLRHVFVQNVSNF